MSSVANSLDPGPVPQASVTPVERKALITVGWFAVLLILCYLPTLIRLVDVWNTDGDMGHGFFVPAIAGYIAWQRRAELARADLSPNWLGLVVVILSGLQGYIGALGAEFFLARTAFVEATVGVVLLLGGWQALRILAFPLALLVFMIPLPSVIYNQITLPLQFFASQVAAFSLEILGVPVLREGNVLELPSQKLSVVEACSGIRSLLSLTFLSLVYGYFFDSKPWMRTALLIATVPIAIGANAFRVTLTGVMSEFNPEWAHGFIHSAQGWVIFMIALVALVLTHQLINWTYKLLHRA